MIQRLLIANRGEIALRIVRACRELNIETVAVYSKVDAALPHLRFVDDTVCISRTSYLEPVAIIAAALSRGCDAVHPGYGFLSENVEFAAEVESRGLTYVGPSPDHLALLGDKARARGFARQHGLPVLPGSESLDDVQAALAAAEDIGYPVLLKAAFGGGGKGIRQVADSDALTSVFAEAQQESQSSFGKAELYLEKYLETPRHIEVQVLGDGNGNAIHLGTRECTVQRRHQKLLEEAPAQGIQTNRLDALAQQVARVAATAKYRNAVTFEFLYEAGEFYFIEANARIQVEHPVTEMVTGIDLVKAQLRIAADRRLSMSQDQVSIKGHAIELRINAESIDQKTGAIVSSPGLISDCVFPGGMGVRVDTHVYSGYQVPHQYDSLLAKLICWGEDRDEAICRSQRALAELSIRGIQTNKELQKRILGNAAFLRGELDTHLIEKLDRK